MDYLPLAEEAFCHHPGTWPELIEMYQRDKAANPIHLAPVFLRSCETIRNEHIREKHEDEKNRLLDLAQVAYFRFYALSPCDEKA